MHQTISGETLKRVKVFDRKVVDSFLSENLEDYSKSTSGRALYSDCTIIGDPIINYLNAFSDKSEYKQLKSLILSEFLKLEKIYPFLGDIFVDYHFDKDSIVFGDKLRFHKDLIDNSKFFDSLTEETSKKIISSILENISLEYSVETIDYKGNDILFRKQNSLFINLDYDTSYLGSKTSHEMNNFKFVLIDGMIESVGEIHHLMFQAAETKIPHVIFCFGVSPEVRHVILENNRKGITEVFPVDMNFNEETINILSDLGVLFQSDVITAAKGETISQEVRKQLSSCKKIIFKRNGISIIPNASSVQLNEHRKFLKNRIEKASNDTNKNLLVNRLKHMTTKSLKIFIPDSLFQQHNFSRQLNYGLIMLSNSQKIMTEVINKKTGKSYYVPQGCVDIIKNKSKSLNEIFLQIDKIVINV